ncbi:MAG TPA: hypothetical protein DDZ80_19765 [Cyanobacteria bacterium UBA8803]|nr:hypothetical protein [Cyanobacteria bacterium UBA9273]HBL60607.1 hypothetical protein [Cyanobacteria bacterium UBA8803]
MNTQKTMTLAGYQISTQIYESANSIVYRAIRETDRKPVILKLLKENYPTPQELTRYKQEYEITRSLNLDGIVRAYGLQKYQNTLVMFLEDFGGESLRILMNQQKFSLKEFLVIAIQAAETLGNIHAAHIIHKDINPSNIVFNPQTKQLKIIDFGISTVLSRENPTLKNVNILEGTLAYMSPEQTGRMNCALDYRTDFYSLGVTFYQLLTGRLPFETTDALELVHSHLALIPIPPQHLNPEIPPVVSDIVMKLLAKNAAERYQSAWGIQADLVTCLMQLEANGEIGEIIPGTHDVSDQFLISQKLYGRERDVETLLNAFERVSEGQRELMLVSGYSGIGKSVLVQEIYKPITRQRGYFIWGKFDQFQRNIPYYALIQAFRELIKQLLTESETQLSQWAAQLLTALGANAQVIIDVIPQVELLIGPQPPVSEVGPAEAQIRFHRVFQNFIRVFSQIDHPLVIFLDDLQWADSATLKLLEQIMSEPNTQSLFLIGAYRDQEVNAAHPLMLTIDEIRLAGVNVNRIKLSPLDRLTVNELIADTLKCDRPRAKPLAELVLAKTKGNPFFVKEFLKSLYAERLLNFDLESLTWQWDIKQIQARGFTDNVVELMAIEIQKLPADTQQVLKLAAAIGNQFEVKTLAIVEEKSLQETALRLHSAVAEGLILPLGEEYKSIELDVTGKESLTVQYKFAHDRIQQAAYSLIPEPEKQSVHLRIGQLLLSHIPAEEREHKIFDIVNQLNLGIDVIKHRNNYDRPQEVHKYVKDIPTPHSLARLNLIAGQKAKASAAYKPALKYLQVGIELLEPDSWLTEYNLSLALFVAAAEAAYLSGEFQQQDELVAVVLQQAKTLLDKVKVYEVKIQSYIAQSKLKEAIATALAVLNLLGVKFPQMLSSWHIWLSFWKTKLVLAGKRIENLIDLPKMTDPNKLAAMRILSSIVAAAYFAVPELMPLLVFKQVKLSVKYGNAPLSASAYASYGILLCDFGQDLDAGYRFSQLALQVLAQFQGQDNSGITDATKAKTLANVSFFARPWKEHLNSTLQPLLEAYSSGLETGDLEAAAYAAHNYCLHSYFAGKDLTKLQEDMTTYGDVLSQLKQERTLRMNKLYRQVIANLRGLTENPYSLSGDLYDELKMLPQHQAANDLTAICVLHFNKLILFYLFESYHQAVENAAIAQKYLEGLRGTVIVPLFHFYDSLARLAVYPKVPPAQQKEILKKVNANQKKMQQWAQHAPMNHLHKFYLVESERYRVLGQLDRAAKFYDLAIERAKANEYLQEEALAYQLAAKFYLSQGKTTIARAYMQDARYSYLQWGAMAKVRDLEERYPQLLVATKSGLDNNPITTSTTSTGSVAALDLATVMKASQAISGEIVLANLLTKFMEILIENAGAQKGFLILRSQTESGNEGGKLLIEAEGSVDSGQVKVLQSIPVGSNGAAPLAAAIVNYVARTKKTVVLNDAARAGSFINDTYIKKHQPKSILCCALLNQGKLIGIVYLENNLTTGAFTPDRLEVLKLLSSQAAIAIENAKLYSELRQRESQLTQFLEAMPVGVAVLDAQGQPYYTNYRAKQLLGKGILPSTTSEKLAEAYQIYVAGTDRLYPSCDLTFVRALQGESTTADDLEIHQTDKVIPIESWGTPIFDEKGKVAYAIVAFTDITERKQAEAERLRFTQELESKNLALQEIDQLKDEFLKTTSHELRTPLNGIIGSMRLILDGFCDDDSEEIELLEQADQSALQLLKIIDRVLDLAKIKSGKLAVEIKPVDLHQELSEAIALQIAQLQQKGLQLYRQDCPQPLPVNADSTKLKQVFLNIIENAIKFTDSGSITISTGIKSAVEDEGELMAIVRIKDTGIGIDPSQQHKLFQPFVMVDGSTTRSQGGIGLGLVISRNLMELMGGSLTLESVGQDRGTTVEIALPLEFKDEG